MACAVGLASLYLPWLIYSRASAWDFTGEFTYVREIGLLDSFFNSGLEYSTMVWMLVIGSFAVLFTFLAVVPLTVGLTLFIDISWGSLGTYSGPDSINHLSLGLGFYLAVAACALGVLSAIPRVSPSVMLVRNEKVGRPRRSQ
jgi:hypothetical protein